MTHDSILPAAHHAVERAFLERVAALDDGEIAVDCGANVGLFTLPMARRGARVFAFEPNPHAFRELARRLAPFPNVTLRQAAVALDRPVALMKMDVEGAEVEILRAGGLATFNLDWM